MIKWQTIVFLGNKVYVQGAHGGGVEPVLFYDSLSNCACAISDFNSCDTWVKVKNQSAFLKAACPQTKQE